ncbi:hypothetical protein KCP77_01460 [Salmonella enterica subsp. enterica]|nr:hypothetical protein KCP77_01460 [Salmonella enterica subsp. enterica]
MGSFAQIAIQQAEQQRDNTTSRSTIMAGTTFVHWCASGLARAKCRFMGRATANSPMARKATCRVKVVIVGCGARG